MPDSGKCHSYRKDTVPDTQEIASGNLRDIPLTVSPHPEFIEYPAEAACILHAGRRHLYSIEIRTETDMVDAGDFHGMVDMVRNSSV